MRERKISLYTVSTPCFPKDRIIFDVQYTKLSDSVAKAKKITISQRNGTTSLDNNELFVSKI